MCGVVEDGIIPGLYGFEAGQSGVGDIFAWFVDNMVPPEYHALARKRKTGLHSLLEQEAARLAPGEVGMVALDWWNGNRSVLVDVDLTGLLLGATLATRAPEIYRTLIESTAFGTRMIIEAFEGNGVAVDELVACGGLPEKNRLLMQIFSDVTGRRIQVAGSAQAGALGSAMFGAVAAGASAGGYDSIFEAAGRMARLKKTSYTPIAAHQSVYNGLYEEYRGLHDYFGRGSNEVMRRLKSVRAAARRRAG
jgi:L-ribulokinase